MQGEIEESPRWRIRLSWAVNSALALLLGTILVLTISIAATGADEAARQSARERAGSLAATLRSRETTTVIANLGMSSPTPDRRFLAPYLVEEPPDLRLDEQRVEATESTFRQKECFVLFQGDAAAGTSDIVACAALSRERLSGLLQVGVGFCDAQMDPHVAGGAANDLRRADHFAFRISDSNGFERLWHIVPQIEPPTGNPDADESIVTSTPLLAFYPWRGTGTTIGDSTLPDHRFKGALSAATSKLIPCTGSRTRFMTFSADLRCLWFEALTQHGALAGASSSGTTWEEVDGLCRSERTRRGWRIEYVEKGKPMAKTVGPILPASLEKEDDDYVRWASGVRLAIEQFDAQPVLHPVARTTSAALAPDNPAIDVMGAPVVDRMNVFKSKVGPGESLRLWLRDDKEAAWTVTGPDDRDTSSSNSWGQRLIQRVSGINRQSIAHTIEVPLAAANEDPLRGRHFNQGTLTLQFTPARLAIAGAVRAQVRQHLWLLVTIFAASVAVVFLVNLTVLRPLRRLAQVIRGFGDEPDAADPTQIPYDRSRTEVGDLARAFIDVISDLHERTGVLKERFFEATARRQRDSVVFEQERQLWPVIAHEIRSPAHALIREFERNPTEDALAHLRLIKRIDTAMEVIEKLRSGESLEDQQREIELNEHCRLWVAAADDRLQPLSVVPFGSPVRVQAAMELLDMILENLVSNATRHRDPEDSPIRLEVDAVGGFGIVRVCNQGTPVPDDRQPYLFRLRYSDGPKRTKNNRGIGLFISRHYAHLMGGELDYVQSEQGATFEIRIPLDVTTLSSS